MLSDRQVIKKMLRSSEERKIGIFTHYTPLHSSKGGKKYSKVCGQMKNTDMAYDQLFRLPLDWYDRRADSESHKRNP